METKFDGNNLTYMILCWSLLRKVGWQEREGKGGGKGGQK